MKSKTAQCIASFLMLALAGTLCAVTPIYECEENPDGTITITGYNGTDEIVEIPEQIDGKAVSAIGNSAFFFCSTMTSLTIPNTVTNIENSAFWFCHKLADVTIGNNVANIGDSAFSACQMLEQVAIPDSVTTLGEFAFQMCSSLQNVTLGNGLLTIGGNAFAQCSALTSITIPDGVTTIGAMAFRNCSSLANATIPGALNDVGESVFENCVNLTNVTIANGATLIGDGMFENCESLASITLPDSVTAVGKHAFLGCFALEYAVIGDGVTNIGDLAFGACVSLTTVQIGTRLTTLGDEAFAYCPSLSGIYFKGDVPAATGANIFDNTISVTAYHFDTAAGWEPIFCLRPTALWGGETVATPTFTPDGGEYEGCRLTVTIYSATPGATIRYTTNGETPTETDNEIASGGSIVLQLSGTLKAKAWKDEYAPSTVMLAYYTTTSCVPQPPKPPVNVSASKATHPDRIQITWTASAQATEYEVWRHPTLNTTPPEKIATTPRTTCDDLDITPNTTYYYSIKAKNEHGASDFSMFDAGFIFSADLNGDLDIWINNLPDRTVHLRRGQMMSLMVNLWLSKAVALDADWWVVAEAPHGLFVFNVVDGNWHPAPNLQSMAPTYQGRIFDFATPFQVMYANTNTLPAGVYRLHFGVDWIMNATLDMDALLYKTVVLHLTN